MRALMAGCQPVYAEWCPVSKGRCQLAAVPAGPHLAGLSPMNSTAQAYLRGVARSGSAGGTAGPPIGCSHPALLLGAVEALCGQVDGATVRAVMAVVGMQWCIDGNPPGNNHLYCDSQVMTRSLNEDADGVLPGGTGVVQLALLMGMSLGRRPCTVVHYLMSCCYWWLLTAEQEQTVAVWQAEVGLKRAHLAARHQLEVEAALQRGARGRDELQLKRQQEEGRHANRLGLGQDEMLAWRRSGS